MLLEKSMVSKKGGKGKKVCALLGVRFPEIEEGQQEIFFGDLLLSGCVYLRLRENHSSKSR